MVFAVVIGSFNVMYGRAIIVVSNSLFRLIEKSWFFAAWNAGIAGCATGLAVSTPGMVNSTLMLRFHLMS